MTFTLTIKDTDSLGFAMTPGEAAEAILKALEETGLNVLMLDSGDHAVAEFISDPQEEVWPDSISIADWALTAFTPTKVLMLDSGDHAVAEFISDPQEEVRKRLLGEALAWNRK